MLCSPNSIFGKRQSNSELTLTLSTRITKLRTSKEYGSDRYIFQNAFWTHVRKLAFEFANANNIETSFELGHE